MGYGPWTMGHERELWAAYGGDDSDLQLLPPLSQHIRIRQTIETVHVQFTRLVAVAIKSPLDKGVQQKPSLAVSPPPVPYCLVQLRHVLSAPWNPLQQDNRSFCVS